MAQEGPVIRQTPDSARSGMGAVAEGVDLSAGGTPEVVEALRQALLRQPVIVVPGQRIGPEALLKLATAFGGAQAHTAVRYRHPDFPDLSYVSNVDRDGKIDTFSHATRASAWHSDGSFLDQPYSFTLLYGLETPRQGGATQFANMYLAYESLPDDLRRRADAAQAVHALGRGPEGAAASTNPGDKAAAAFTPITWPVIRIQPETGRRSIYINPIHTTHIVGADEAEARALYRDLLEFCVRPEFVYEHRWRVGDLVIWDQRSTMHRAAGGVPLTERRVLLRAHVKGEALVA